MTKFEISSIKQRKAEDEALFVSGGLGDDRDYDGDDGGGSDGEGGGTVGDDASHSKLLTDIIKLNKNKRREAKRSVRTSSLGGAPSGVDTDRLLKRLESTKLNKSVPRLITLDTPVEKTVARKAKRAAGFEKVAIESEKWARLVDRRRKAEQVSFPLQRPDLRYSQVEKVEQQQYKPKTSLEEKVFGLLQGAKLLEQKVETKEEQAARRAMSLQELKERNRELWREREMRRRYEHKAMMHNKSKSRKHHRLLRRDKLKQQRSEMEELQRKDPEAALGVLQDLERARVEERMSLRHKKSKWAHLQGPRATRDKQAMAALKENQRMHRELTAKVDKPAMEDDDDDDDDTTKKIEEMLKERAVAIESGTYDPMNPWTNNLAQPPGGGPAGGAGGTGGEAQEEDQSYTKFVKFWDEFNQRKAFDKKLEEEMERREEEEEDEKKEEQEEEEDDDDDDDDEDYEDIETEEEEEVKKVEPKKKGNKKNKSSGVKAKKATTKLKKGQENKGKEKVIKKGKCEQEEEEEEENDDEDDDEDYEDIEDEEEEEVKQIEPKKKGNKKSSGVEAKKATTKLKTGKGKKKVIKKGKENVIKKTECEEAKKLKKTKKGKLVKNVVEEEKGPEEKTTKKKKITKKQAQNLKVTESDITVQTKKKKAQSLDAAGVKISPIQTNQQKKTNDPGNNPTQKSTKKKKKKKMESIEITSIETPKTKLNKVEVTSIQTPPKTKLNKVEVTSTETPKTKLNKKSPKGKPVVNSVEVPQTETATSIVDELFDQAEEGIKRTVKRKLEKLGITAEANQTWTKISRKKKKPLEKEKPVMVEEYDFTTTHNAENIDETLERNVQLEESEGADRNTDKGKGALEKAFITLKNGTDEDNNNNNNNKNNKTQDNKKAGKYANVDPTKFIQVSTKKLVTSLPDTVAGGEEGLDDSEEEEEGGRPGGGEEEEEDPEDVIREAFADDYLIDEFNSEKKAAIAKDKLAPLSLALPGWGDWAGPNIKMSKNKMKRYRMNAPKEVRKDSNIGNVIYNETADVHDNLRSAMVSDLPYPFKSVKDFEASVRAPIGRMFVPETTHKKLTMPALTTRLGTVIDPMTEDQLLKTRHAGTVKTKEQSNREKAKRERQEREKEELSEKESKSGGGVKRKRNWNRKK